MKKRLFLAAVFFLGWLRIASCLEVGNLEVLGNIGVGTTAPSVNLDVVNIIKAGTYRIGTGLLVSGTPVSGQLLIGESDGDFARATLTAGTGISITNDSGSITLSSFFIPNSAQVFTTSGTFSASANITKVYVKLWGAGGGGQQAGNAPGGAGGYCEGFSTISGSVPITVGLGAMGANTNPAPSGSKSIFAGGITLTANGGTGGANGPSPGAGGTATGGLINITGGNGILQTAGSYGIGGDSPFGGRGGVGGIQVDSGAMNGQFPGGGGGSNIQLATSGSGGNGCVIVLY